MSKATYVITSHNFPWFEFKADTKITLKKQADRYSVPLLELAYEKKNLIQDNFLGGQDYFNLKLVLLVKSDSISL